MADYGRSWGLSPWEGLRAGWHIESAQQILVMLVMMTLYLPGHTRVIQFQSVLTVKRFFFILSYEPKNKAVLLRHQVVGTVSSLSTLKGPVILASILLF